MAASDNRFSREAFYDAYPRIEAEFQAALESSLTPYVPELLYDLVSGFLLSFKTGGQRQICQLFTTQLEERLALYLLNFGRWER